MISCEPLDIYLLHADRQDDEKTFAAFTKDMFGGKRHSHCTNCGRPLSNPLSIKRGMGLVCWLKGHSPATATDQTRKGTKEDMSEITFKENVPGKPIDDFELKYPGYHSPEKNAVCRVRVFNSAEIPGGKVVLISQLQRNTGLSITNGIEMIAGMVRKQLELRDDTVYVEHYPDRRPPMLQAIDAENAGKDTLGESFDLVTFNTTLTGGFHAPRWQHSTRAAFGALVGAKESESHE